MTTRRQWHAKGLKRPPPAAPAPVRRTMGRWLAEEMARLEASNAPRIVYEVSGTLSLAELVRTAEEAK